MQDLDVGKTLRDERQKQGKSLEEVYEETRVSVAHLQFLEDNNFTFLPGTYVKSFLKTYAQWLGLDIDELLSAYQGSETKSKPEPKPDEVIGEDDIALTTPEKLEKTTQRDNYVLPVRKFVEWSIGVGTLALLVGTVLLYIQFRSQIYASPPDRLTYRETHQAVDMAHVSLRATDASDSLPPALQLNIVPTEDVWIELNIDGAVSEHTMSPGVSRSWLAKDGFDIRIGRLVTRSRRQVQRDSVDRRSVLSFSLTRDHLR